MAQKIFFIFTLILLSSPSLFAADRFFLSGDGVVHLSNPKTKVSSKIQYRLPDGTYPEKARQQINRLFGVPANSSDSISLRLISLLDYVEDRYKQPIEIISGYRSPEYNEGLRKNGKLAAKASLHIEGMAADIQMRKMLSVEVVEMIKKLNCCGVGYYHGNSFHLDTGPARFWDEKTSKVETDISSRNKLIMVKTDFDIYRPGDSIEFQFARITDYPVGIGEMKMSIVKEGKTVEKYLILDEKRPECVIINSPTERRFSWELPKDLPYSDSVQFEFKFCKKLPEMPEEISSNPVTMSRKN